MNVLPCKVEGGKAVLGQQPIETVNAKAYRGNGKILELGVRPEFVTFAESGVAVEVAKIVDAGRYRIVEAHHGDRVIKMLVPEVPIFRRARPMFVSIRRIRRSTRTGGW